MIVVRLLYEFDISWPWKPITWYFIKMADLVQQEESDDEKVAIVAYLTIMSAAVAANYFAETRERSHSCCVLGYLRNRSNLGSYNCLMRDLNMYDPVKLKNYLMMEPGIFEELFTMVDELITTKNTRFRQASSLSSSEPCISRFQRIGSFCNDQIFACDMSGRNSPSLAAMFIIIFQLNLTRSINAHHKIHPWPMFPLSCAHARARKFC